MARPPSADSILRNAKKKQFEPKTEITTGMFIPNHSGDLSAGKVLTSPTQDLNVVNKKYVDDSIDTDIATHAALDTGVHGAGADTIATDADIATHAALPNVHHNKLHASTHEVAGDDLVNHDDLTGFVANEHIDWTNATQDLETTGDISAVNLALTGKQTITGNASSGTILNMLALSDGTNNLDIVGGYAMPSGAYGALNKTISGLSFGTFNFFTDVSGSSLDLIGINTFSHGSYSGTSDIDVDNLISFNIENQRYVFGGNITANNAYAIKTTPYTSTGTGTIVNEYGIYLHKPAIATNNYQFVLQGTGSGSGIWLGGTGGKRLYNDNTDIRTTATFRAGGYKANTGASGIAATITTFGPNSNGSMTFVDGLLTAQVAAT